MVGVSAQSPTGAAKLVIEADLAGRPIKPYLVSSFYCHDFDYPAIHCFRTATELEAAEAARAGSSPGLSSAFSAADYVTIFDGTIWSGAYMDVSQNYDALFSIGWNDRVGSYKARNSASGKFWTDWYASGTSRSFCCNTQVSSLPAGLDNAFSSVYRQ
ncbi:MAG: hypothetical protein H0U52_08640 [Chloroflexi bacterium]|nr:hypothetical protein [Chloroflexota bacterium]